MLENDLNMRNQFASKIIDKVKKINDDIKLLSKVDKQLLKNINKKGGNIENFHINKIGGGPALTDTDRQLKIAQTQLKLQEMAKLKDKLEKIKKAKEDNDFKNSATADANSNSIRKLSGIITRLEEFIKLFDQLNEMVSAYEVPDLGDFTFRDLKKINMADIDKLNDMIPSGLTIFDESSIEAANSRVEELKTEYIKLAKKEIPRYTFDQTSGADDLSKVVVWKDNVLIPNEGGAYYEILDKFLEDPILKNTFSKDNKEFIHRRLGITALDTEKSNIEPVYKAYTYLNEQKELKEEKVKEKEKLEKILKDMSRTSDHAAATKAIADANAEILKIDQLIVIAQTNYNKMIGKSDVADINAKNTEIIAAAEQDLINKERAYDFLNRASGDITKAINDATAVKNEDALKILNGLTLGADNLKILLDSVNNLGNEIDTAKAIDALRIAIRDHPDDNNTNIIPKITSISTSVDKIITDAITTATATGDLEPRNVLASLKSTSAITMVGGGRSSRRNSSRTSRHNSSRTSRHDSSSTSRHSGW